MRWRRWIKPLSGFGLLSLGLLLLLTQTGFAAEVNLPGITLNTGGVDGEPDPEQVSTALQILAFMTLFSLAPGLLVMVTSFTRVIVVMSFVRQAMGLQGQPPNQVLIALSLFITFFVMGPIFDQVWDNSLTPYLNKQINAQAAWDNAVAPVKDFMLRQTREKDLGLFMKLAGMESVATKADAPLRLVIPAFMVSELKTAFQIGFMIYLPFLIIDMVVASVVMSMGMMMLPPLVISMPIKLILFVLVDGWILVVGSLVQSFR
uniref:Flagellar biosynthetic protein FliP n=1 Tax=Magnetococcus massalia (strain MO-1) TaxID=451514 RepID=A0A1S7LMS2_MAGMO|nr:Flagellar biosynthetic protein FliP [Candidatus Magnetococcus massalia]